MQIMIVFIVALASLAPLSALSQDCGALRSVVQYGPYDYRTDKDKLEIVEIAHFTPDVEFLRQQLSGYFGADIDYTLRAFPNHHRALMSMVNLVLKTHTDKPKGARYPMDCYFERAVRFAADDGTVRMIRGIYLDRLGKKKEALDEFKVSERLGPENANLQYNLGLVYLDLRQYDDALQYAQRAYKNGAQLPGLKKRLVAAGKWQDPPSQTEGERGAVDAGKAGDPAK